MSDITTEAARRARTRRELKRFGAECFYSFAFSAVTVFVLCALTPQKSIEEVGSLTIAEPLHQ